MIAIDYIVEDIPRVRTSDTGNQVLLWMDMYRVSHLPIVNNEQLLGLISEKDIYDNQCEEDVIGNHNLSLVNPYVFDDQHLFEIIDIVAKLNLSIVPVLNRKKEYLGSITQAMLIKAFSQMISIEKAGSIIVLEMTIHDYSSSEIAQIIESNNAKILSLFLSPHPNSTKISLTIKIDVTDINSIIKTFERYNYNIKASFLHEDIIKNFYDNRYESFINYLNI